MNVETFVARYPRLFHMAEDGSWPAIRHHGLLSTSALLDLYEVEGDERRAIESQRRPESVSITHPEYGEAIIRDNKPIQDVSLRRCLHDMTLDEWYELLNSKVFFWVSEKRLHKFLNARSYRDRTHLVLEVDAAKLLERHAERVRLSRINSGATFAMNPAPRGSNTFRPIVDHSEDQTVVELAVDHSVPDVADFVVSLSRWRGDYGVEDVWSKPSG